MTRLMITPAITPHIVNSTVCSFMRSLAEK